VVRIYSVRYRQAVDRMKKSTLDIMKQNQRKVKGEVIRDSGQKVQREVLTGSGQTVEDSSGENTEPTYVQCYVLTDIGQTIKGSSGHSDTEPRDGNA